MKNMGPEVVRPLSSRVFFPVIKVCLTNLKNGKKKSSCMLFNAGFLANQALLKHLPGKNDLVLADKLIHHSMAQALTKGSARFKRYHHLDLDHLEEILNANYKDYETVFVVTESVFSMDGDYPDLKKLVELKKNYSFILINFISSSVFIALTLTFLSILFIKPDKTLPGPISINWLVPLLIIN